jgi:hypothetical protein
MNFGLKKYFQGELSRKEIKRHISITFPIYLALILISLMLYPKDYHYSIMTHTMSYLGNYLISPGWIFFSVGVIFLAIATVPCIRYLENAMRPINDWADEVSTFLFEVSWITMFAIGLLPDIQIDHWLTHWHVQVATISMITYATAGALFWGRGRKVLKKYTFTFGKFYYIALAIMVITQIYARTHGYPYPGPGIFSFPFWEWILFFSYLGFFYSMVLEIPENQSMTTNELAVSSATGETVDL